MTSIVLYGLNDNALELIHGIFPLMWNAYSITGIVLEEHSEHGIELNPYTVYKPDDINSLHYDYIVIVEEENVYNILAERLGKNLDIVSNRIMPYGNLIRFNIA